MKTRLGCKHNDVLRDSISKLTSGGRGSNMSCRETQCRLESLRALLMALRGSAMDWRRNRIVLMVGTNSGLILSRLWTEVYEIWDDVNDPLYFSTPLPSCLCYFSFKDIRHQIFALILLRLQRYTSHVLTYLLTYYQCI